LLDLLRLRPVGTIGNKGLSEDLILAVGTRDYLRSSVSQWGMRDYLRSSFSQWGRGII